MVRQKKLFIVILGRTVATKISIFSASKVPETEW